MSSYLCMGRTLEAFGDGGLSWAKNTPVYQSSDDPAGVYRVRGRYPGMGPDVLLPVVKLAAGLRLAQNQTFALIPAGLPSCTAKAASTSSSSSAPPPLAPPPVSAVDPYAGPPTTAGTAADWLAALSTWQKLALGGATLGLAWLIFRRRR